MPYIYKWRYWRRWLPIWLRRTTHARPIVLFIQRGRRGYTDEDLWSFDYYLAHVIGNGLRQLAKTTHTYPSSSSPEEWDRQLRETANKLLAWDKNMFCDQYTYENAKNGMKWVADNFGDLWD